MAVVMLFL